MADGGSFSYTVFVGDNYHYMDEEARYELGTFEDLDSALAACRRLVDDFLAETHKPGMSADELIQQYKSFGPDPYIVSTDDEATFSAWEYAEERCYETCG